MDNKKQFHFQKNKDESLRQYYRTSGQVIVKGSEQRMKNYECQKTS
jgi:hypothetical protein